MSIKDFDKLEERINHVLENLKQLREENQQLKEKLNGFQQEADQSIEEKEEIKKRVNSLLTLLETIENNATNS